MRLGRCGSTTTLIMMIMMMYVVGYVSASAGECGRITATETLEIGPTKGKLLEIHIRNNIQVRNYISETILNYHNVKLM